MQELRLEEKLPYIRTLTDFEAQIGAPLHGYKDLEEYYTDLSPHKKILDITVPCFIFSALDDPVCGFNVLDIPSLCGNDNVLVGTTKSGSHNGHYERFWSTHQFLVKPVFEYLDFMRENAQVCPF